MKAIRVTAYGEEDVLASVDLDQPVAADGAVLVKVEYAGVNYLDIQVRRGMYEIPTPFTAGFEGAGTIEQIGAGVTGLCVGQKIVWSNVLGAYAEYALVPAAQAVPVPDGVAVDLAVAAQVQGITADYLIHDVHPVTSGDVVLVHAAAGGVGSLLTQLARAKGATVIATASSPAKRDLASKAGAAYVFGYDEFEAGVKQVTDGRGVDAVFDGIGADTYEASARSLRTRGTLALYGEASGAVPAFDPSALGAQSITVIRPSFGDYTATRDELLEHTSRVHQAIREGSLSIEVDSRLGLQDAAEAQRLLQSRNTSGKLVLTVAQ